MANARLSHTATLLQNGKVLVVGGTIDGTFHYSSAELYDPSTNTWSSAGDMGRGNGRSDHTATLLPSGKVLVAGGSGGASYLASAELYDPSTNTWSSAGNMINARAGHTATLLTNGTVLVTSGVYYGTSNPPSCELYW
jgi:N-acetylneuraminic acid mutarotase